MRKSVLLGTALVIAACLSLYSEHQLSSGATPQKKPAGTKAEPALSQKPTVGDPAAEARFAWYLFIQAMKPSTGSLTFESWTEQCELNPAMIGCESLSGGSGAKSAVKGKVRRGHGSALARAMAQKLQAATGQNPASQVGCGSMNTAKSSFTPTNLAQNPIFCEEVFVNPSEAGFVKTKGLITLSGQETYGKAHSNAITFPWTAVEIKVDWIPASSLTNPTFSCPDPTNSLYTETIQFEGQPSQCYAMVGVHISSKVLPNWLWATFEPNSAVTNPNRCKGDLYDTCFDPWGTTSSQPYGHGQPVSQSPALHQAMAAAKLNPAFNNYFLTGAEAQFVSGGKPVLLGNSFIEYNAQVPPLQASCITCHKYAYFDGTQPPAGQPEDNFGGPPQGWAAVGYACNQPNPPANCTPVVPNSVSQDFSWMLGLMPYASPAGHAAGTGKSKSPTKPPAKSQH